MHDHQNITMTLRHVSPADTVRLPWSEPRASTANLRAATLKTQPGDDGGCVRS
jgi:hypothetical protein